ncbi:lipoprotein [Streptomyces humi]|uniref:lipoprotein n=1 Tax=Streptomyces humi TaxID=1428620 RepID=UPI000628710A|nr:lipoprotein [Streptomyces humi]
MPQQQRRSPTGRLVRGAAVLGSLALLPLTAACTGEDDATDDKSSKTRTVSAQEAQVVAPAKVEVIANLTQCKPKIRVEAEELREGVCHTKGGDYLITTFPEERHKQTWLDTIAMYQGTYLVGTRWVVSAQPKVLKAFQPKLGGDIVHMTGMGPGVTQSPS